MQISRYNLKNIHENQVEVPDMALMDLSEKVIQFGTGVLLRGLPDYFIDKANKQGIFNGRIVVVKSTDWGDTAAFEKQDGLYTICVRGIEDGKQYEENIISASISRVLSAKTAWNRILECAHNPGMQIIISNTTEAGIALTNEDVKTYPPVSFPGKLLAFLFERYKAFEGSKQSGMVIIPTELIPDNGKKLESIVTELAYLNGFDENFIDWLENCNHFCNSLVDRIVPGKPDEAVQEKIEKSIGYTDELLIISEVYRLWAIEGGDEVKKILSFASADKGVVIADDIEQYREMKLRLLNGTHTLSCGIAYLSGLETVKSAMDDVNVEQYINMLMMTEIAPAIPYSINPDQSEAFANIVLDRFRNPMIEHHWHNISMQFSSKMKTRVIPVLLNYYKIFNKVPKHIALGYAAYLLFMKPVKKDKGNYYGFFNGTNYQIRDDKAAYFYDRWQHNQPGRMAAIILADKTLWGTDLNLLPGFAETVQEKLDLMIENGVQAIWQAPQPQIISA